MDPEKLKLYKIWTDLRAQTQLAWANRCLAYGEYRLAVAEGRSPRDLENKFDRLAAQHDILRAKELFAEIDFQKVIPEIQEVK